MSAVGYDWSARSMGKAIDALQDALVELAEDDRNFFDEELTVTNKQHKVR